MVQQRRGGTDITQSQAEFFGLALWWELTLGRCCYHLCVLWGCRLDCFHKKVASWYCVRVGDSVAGRGHYTGREVRKFVASEELNFLSNVVQHT